MPIMNRLKGISPMNCFMRAVIYTRVSTSDQAQDGHSLDEQHRQCIQLIELHGHDVVNSYNDVGSGSTFEHRPNYQTMVNNMKSEWDIVYVWKLDRLNRNLRNQVQFFDSVGKNDCYVASVTEQVDTSTPYGRFIMNVMSSLAQMEREQISERVIMGQGAARNIGRYIGGAPYGYNIPVEYDDNGNRTNKGQLIVNDEEAAVVRVIFDKILEGSTVAQICNFLVESGIRTRKNNVIWSYGTVTNIINRRHLYIFGKEKPDEESKWEPILFLTVDEASGIESRLNGTLQ